MLRNYPVYASIAVKDLGKARAFYEQTLGFTTSMESDEGVMYDSGGTRLFVYPSQFAGTAQQTVASWEVDDLDKVAEDLRGRGIRFEQYDFPGLKTVDGIAEIQGVKGAWFKDPDGNIIAVGQQT